MPTLPMCGHVNKTNCPAYDGSVRISWYLRAFNQKHNHSFPSVSHLDPTRPTKRNHPPIRPRALRLKSPSSIVLKITPPKPSSSRPRNQQSTRIVARLTYPLSEVLKTTSPTCVARAPNDRPRHTLPSSRTSLQSVSSQGLLTAAPARVTVLLRVVVVVVRRVGADAWRRVAAVVVVRIVVVALIFAVAV